MDYAWNLLGASISLDEPIISASTLEQMRRNEIKVKNILIVILGVYLLQGNEQLDLYFMFIAK